MSVRTGGTATRLDESTRTETTEALSVRSVSISCAGADSSSLISVSSTEAVTIEHGRQGLRSCRDSTVRAASWLGMFVDKVGDRMPTDGTIHLPSCLTKSDVYNLAQEDLSQGGIPMCSRSSFFRLWKNDFKHVKIPPVSSNIIGASLSEPHTSVTALSTCVCI